MEHSYFSGCPQEPVFSGTCGQGLTWYQDGDVLHIEGRGEIAPHAFDEDDSIRHVIIGPGCTGIGADAFHYCEQLKTVQLPEGLLWIGDYAFWWSTLEEVNLPSTLTRIGKRAFFGCGGIRRLAVPASVTWIGEEAFEGVRRVAFSGD